VADATGILAAGVVAMLGLTIIPHRRRQSIEALRERTSRLRSELRTSLGDAFQREMQAVIERMDTAIAPYARFVRSERERLAATRSALSDVRADARALRHQLAV
jgi:hypothetical protein